MKLLEVNDLRTYFYTHWGLVKAVDGVSFSVGEGESLGLVGESGCGKSVTCLSILRLLPQPAGRIVGGQILLQGENLLDKSDKEMEKIRGAKISMILQDPMIALNPVFSVGNQLGEAIKLHQKLEGKSLYEKAWNMLEIVRIASPEQRLQNYPHELSGGISQRVVTAIALSCKPHLLIADEPTTSLDATIQVQILRLLREFQQQMGLALIFITHDFGIVARMCKQVAVMYAGKIVETAEVRTLFDHPMHPYTEALMKAVPRMEKGGKRLTTIEGEPPRLYSLPPGCAFAPRCTYANDKCREQYPPIIEVRNGQCVACWKYFD